MENQFFNKVIELTVKGFVSNGNYDITHTKMLVNDLKQFIKLYEVTEEPVKKERKPRKKKEEPKTNEPKTEQA